MGEAKRRNKQGKQVEEVLLQRIQAGEFGAQGQPLSYCVVLDKSPRGKDMLQTLRAMPAFGDLLALLQDEALELWEASPLFRFIVLCAGSGKPNTRIFVAADIDKLTREALPRGLRSQKAAGTRPGLVIAVSDEFEGAIQRAAEHARQAV